MHFFICITIFSLCYKLLWQEQVYVAVFFTFMYIFIMASWALYVRFPLYMTYSKFLGGIGHSKIVEKAKMRKNLVLEPYTPLWQEQFDTEYQRTRPMLISKWKHILHEELTPDGIVHIGSTAIRDIALAKPQHDCGLAVTCHSLPKQFCADLAELGYLYIGVAPHSLDCADHFFYYLPNPEDQARLGEGFFLHVLTPKVHDWLRTSLAFCEYLSHDTAARESYSNLKKEISTVGKNISLYSMKKYDLAMKLREEAIVWQANRNKSG